MFDLIFFYEDTELTNQKQTPNTYKLQDAISDTESGDKTIVEAANLVYETKMWQWFHIYTQWDRKGRQGEMFQQPDYNDSYSELYSHFREYFKSQRSTAVDNLKVTVDGMVFDGDEISRFRMTTAILSLNNDTETVKWALADNTVANVTSVQLKQVLRLSGIDMENIWFQP
jgi:hypothetical protein